jgi:hypothetical protein
MIKFAYQHSILYNVNEKTIRKFFHVGHKKSQKLLAAIQESDLFIYNAEKKCVYAKPFKSKQKVFNGKNGQYEAYQDYCYKMCMPEPKDKKNDREKKEYVTLRNVVKELRYILALNVVNAVERTPMDNLENPRKAFNVTKPKGSDALPHRIFARYLGVSRSTACRCIKEMIDDRRVSKTRIVAECVIPHLNENTEREWRAKHPKKGFVALHNVKRGGWSGWVIYGNAYTITNRRDSDAFRNVIYNYERGKEKYEYSNSGEIDGGKNWG